MKQIKSYNNFKWRVFFFAEIVEKTLSSTVRLTGISENLESRLRDLAEYKRMVNNIEKAVSFFQHVHI